MTDMIEKVAREILVQRYSDYAGYGEYEPGAVEIDETLPEAKAFIKALEAKGLIIVPREPSEAMVAAAQKPPRTIHDRTYLTAHSVETRYLAMLAALEGKE